VKGLSRDDADRIIAERAARPFASIEDFALRLRLDEGVMTRLAAAGAFESLVRERRDALWQALGMARAPTAPLGLAETDDDAAFRDLDALETTIWDYRTMGLSARAHPLQTVRGALRAMQLPCARDVAAGVNGRRMRYAGLVICRQRPGTASGVVFMTLEDETGFVNVVVWPRTFDRYASLIRTATFLGVAGKLQAEQGVVHIIADSFWTPRLPMSALPSTSHDFH
jgi:error-prone DNA polymerase